MRITVRQMMVLVAIAGLVMAAARTHLALGGFVASIFCLPLIRVYGAIDASWEKGAPTRSTEVVKTTLSSALVTATIMVPCLVTSLLFFFFFDVFTGPRTAHPQPIVLDVKTIASIVIAAAMAFPIAWIPRRRWWE
jgi:hypothetical protein